VRQAAKWLVAIWHLLVLGALIQALGSMRPIQQHFRKPSAWKPMIAWLQNGEFFHFGTGRAAATFLLVALAAGTLVFIVYFFDDRVRGWLAMLLWNGLGIFNYSGPRTRILSAIFDVAFVLTFVSGGFFARRRGS